MSPRFGRAAAYLIAPAVCLALYWRVFSTWFLNDDFAWLSLPLLVSAPHDLWHVFFAPQAQGTVRVISERLFFLVFSGLFGLHPLPYRLWVLATWFADLTLGTVICARLTGSRTAGILSAILWTMSIRMLTPLAWASAYNEVACSFFILAAFYARLRWLENQQRKWLVAEWIAYLLGFGALEVMVMYPALAALYSLTQPKVTRTRRQAVWPLFVPALLFTIAHFVFIPKTTSPHYVLKVDWRLPLNFLHYLGWATSFSRVEPGSLWHVRELMVPILVTLALLAFAISRLRRREFAAVFFVGWFVLLLAPMLPLPNHVIDYYLAIPVAGLAWLGGWGIVASWEGGLAERAVAAGLAAVYLVGSGHQIGDSTRWYQERAAKMRTLVLGLKEEARMYPGAAFVLQGVDKDLYQSGFEDDPFRLLGITRIYLPDGRDVLDRFKITPDRSLGLIKMGEARVLNLAPEGLRDVTTEYEATLIASSAMVRHEFVDVGNPLYALLLGPTWYPAERGFRWMPQTASVRISAPRKPGSTLHVTGFAPEALLANGPRVLRFRIGEREIGTAIVGKPEGFTVDIPAPADLTGQDEVELSIEVNKVLRPAGEQRDLGMVFGTFEFR